MSQHSPGWYNDPQNPQRERYWDGFQWTDKSRKDVPDIPLAPWVDPAHPHAHVGYQVDTAPPRSSVGPWLALLVAVLGVAMVFTVGYLKTSETIQAHSGTGSGAEPAERPVAIDPPPGSGPDIIGQRFDCQQLALQAIEWEMAEPVLGLQSVNTNLQVIQDNQPMTALPPAGTNYRVLECQGTGQVANQDNVPLNFFLSLSSAGELALHYGAGY